MTQDYYGTKRVTAWCSSNPNQDIKDEGVEPEEGYAVKYADGYISWSPKEVFEKSYQSITAMNFSHALEAMKTGYKLTRSIWLPGSYISRTLVKDNFNEYNSIMVMEFRGKKNLWYPEHCDIFANDWSIIE